MTQIPSLIYGTAWKKEHTAALVIEAIHQGFLGIDTACQPKHYQEAGIGKALAELKKEGIKREKLYIQTKFTPLSGQDPNNIPYDKNNSLSQQVAQSFRKSLQNLQTEYVDGLILHSPLFPFSNLLEVWRSMEEIYNQKKALRLGISNCYDLEVLQKLYDEAQIKPSILQNRFYADSGYDKELREWCLTHDVTYQSFWSLTANPHLLSHPLLQTLSVEYNKTAAQIFFRFLIQIGIIPLTGTSSSKHMREDLSIFDFALTPKEQSDIELLLV